MLKGQSPFRGNSFKDWLAVRVVHEDRGFGSPCWTWALTTDAKGYARWRLPRQFGWGHRTVALHRVAYEQLIGPIPHGLVIDHLCRNRACLNPRHLEPVTAAENTRRGFNQFVGRTHCSRGHEYTPENTTFRSHGARRCKECQRQHNRNSRARDIADCEREQLDAKVVHLPIKGAVAA